MKLVAATSRHEGDWTGRYVAGTRWLYFVADPTLSGMVVWGTLERDDGRQLVDFLSARLAERTGPARGFLVDARDLSGISPTAFAPFVDLIRGRRDLLSTHIRKVALVRGEGLIAAVTSGFLTLAPMPFDGRTFDALAPALGFLEAKDAGLDAALDAARIEVEGESKLLRELRAILDVELGGADVRAVARKLGLSLRSLQRRLGTEGTGFQKEVAAAQVRFGKRRLVESDDKLSVIAAEAGCASAQYFSVLFKKATGQTPSEWREHHRAIG
jgi:AraC-like DNA-binding protein